MDLYMSLINERIERLSKAIDYWSVKKKKKHTDALRIRTIKGKTRYWSVNQNDSQKEKYISSKDMDRIRSLAQNGYDEKVIMSAQKELEFLRKFISKYPVKPEDIYHQLDEVRKGLVEPFVYDDEMYAQRWVDKQYCSRTIDDDIPTFKTAKGEMVISKSEKIIADSLFRLGIPYKYDCPLKLLDENGRVLTKYPDFTALNVKRRKVYYVEHLGMMDDPGYIERNLKKIDLYERNGIYPGDNLILIHETSKKPLDVDVMEKMLKRFLIEE